ncbi:MAG TPA: hypothetical protein VN248_01110, partial [Arenimonas sp.]|nr:hypothetical protein [Arenimonas sp.]
LIDIDADGALDVALQNKGSVLHLFRQVGGYWRPAGTVSWRSECTRIAEPIKRGAIRALTPELQDLEIGGVRYRINSMDNAVAKTGCVE